MFMIEDELHAEPGGKFATFADALAELRRRADIAWDVEPNRAPCVGWQTCGRAYEIVEYDDSQVPWRRVQTARTGDFGGGHPMGAHQCR